MVSERLLHTGRGPPCAAICVFLCVCLRACSSFALLLLRARSPPPPPLSPPSVALTAPFLTAAEAVYFPTSVCPKLRSKKRRRRWCLTDLLSIDCALNDGVGIGKRTMDLGLDKLAEFADLIFKYRKLVKAARWDVCVRNSYLFLILGNLLSSGSM